MPCTPLVVIPEVCTPATRTNETLGDGVYTGELMQPTGYNVQDPCCGLTSLQILYGMPYLTGSGIKTGSTP